MNTSQTITTLTLPSGHIAEDVDVLISYTCSPYGPGCTSGPPEKCYPPEGGEVEMESIQLAQNTSFYFPTDSNSPEKSLPAGTDIAYLFQLSENAAAQSRLEDQLFQEAMAIQPDYPEPDRDE